MDEFYYLRYLKVLISVLSGKTLTETSREFDLTQPGVTKIIQKTETLLGIKLLDRSKRSAYAIDVTEDGKVMLRYMEEILQHHSALMEEFSRGDTIKILLAPLEMNLYSDILIEKLKQQLPNRKIIINVASNINFEEIFIKNGYNLGVFPSPVSENKRIDYLPLKIQDFVAILYNYDKDVDEIDFDEIKHLPVILQGEGFKIRELLLNMYANLNVTINISKIAFFFGAKYGCVNSKFTDKNVMFVSKDFIKAYGDNEDIRNFSTKIKNNREIGAFQELFIGYRKNRKLSSDEKKVVMIIKECIK